VASCDSPSFAPCVIACSIDGRCPDEFECSNGLCTNGPVCPARPSERDASGAGGSIGSIESQAGDGGRADGGAPTAEAAGTGGTGGEPSYEDAGNGGVITGPANEGGEASIPASAGASGDANLGGPSSEPTGPKTGSAVDPTFPDLSEVSDPDLLMPTWSNWHENFWPSGITRPRMLRNEDGSFSTYFLSYTGRISFVDESAPGVYVDNGDISGGLIANDPVAATRPGGITWIFARGLDEQPWRATRWPGEGSPTWDMYDVKLRNSPVVATGELDVFIAGRGLDDQILIKGDDEAGFSVSGIKSVYQPTLVPASTYQAVLGATDLEGTVHTAIWRNDVEFSWQPHDGLRADSPPALVSRGDDQFDVVVRRDEDDCYYWAQRSGESKLKWAKISGPFVSFPHAVPAGTDGFYVFGKDARGSAWVRRHKGGNWTQWVLLGGSLSTEHDVEFPGDALADEAGRIVLYARSAERLLVEIWTEPEPY
jgi:hypothetical protein